MKLRNLPIFLLALIDPLLVQGASLRVVVQNSEQQPVEYAVVYVTNLPQEITSKTITVDQIDKEFIPYVTAIPKGSSINFANNDNIRHQVYSFSQSKQFEIPLYGGSPQNPVQFDSPGAVPLGCNIHDWMSAYVYVLENDKFTLTNKNGEGTIVNLPSGNYELQVWHPKLDGETEDTRQTVVVGKELSEAKFSILQKPVWRAWRAPTATERRGY